LVTFRLTINDITSICSRSLFFLSCSIRIISNSYLSCLLPSCQ